MEYLVLLPDDTKETIATGSDLFVGTVAMMKLDGDGASDTEDAPNVS